MTESTTSRYPQRLTRAELIERAARFCADCGSHHEYALLDDAAGLAVYRMDADRGRRVAEAEDAESAAQLGRVVDALMARRG